jgi:hypothetical protein
MAGAVAAQVAQLEPPSIGMPQAPPAQVEHPPHDEQPPVGQVSQAEHAPQEAQPPHDEHALQGAQPPHDPQ